MNARYHGNFIGNLLMDELTMAFIKWSFTGIDGLFTVRSLLLPVKICNKLALVRTLFLYLQRGRTKNGMEKIALYQGGCGGLLPQSKEKNVILTMIFNFKKGG